MMSAILTSTREGRPDGEAYVELRDRNDHQRALGMNREYMGARYVEGDAQLVGSYC